MASEATERPPVWIGHVTLATPCLAETHELLVEIGMREIVRTDEVGVLELRGGTHLVLLPGDEPASGEAYFDLMVDDLDATHARLRAAGLSPSEIQAGKIHSSFTLASPSGHTLKFNSTHVSDQPV